MSPTPKVLLHTLEDGMASWSPRYPPHRCICYWDETVPQLGGRQRPRAHSLSLAKKSNCWFRWNSKTTVHFCFFQRSHGAAAPVTSAMTGSTNTSQRWTSPQHSEAPAYGTWSRQETKPVPNAPLQMPGAVSSQCPVVSQPPCLSFRLPCPAFKTAINLLLQFTEWRDWCSQVSDHKTSGVIPLPCSYHLDFWSSLEGFSRNLRPRARSHYHPRAN